MRKYVNTHLGFRINLNKDMYMEWVLDIESVCVLCVCLITLIYIVNVHIDINEWRKWNTCIMFYIKVYTC